MADERPPSRGPSQSIDMNSGVTTAQTTRFGRGAAGEQGDTVFQLRAVFLSTIYLMAGF